MKEILSSWDEKRIHDFVQKKNHSTEGKELVDAMQAVGLNLDKGSLFIDNNTKDLMFRDTGNVRETGQHPLINLTKVTDAESIEPSSNKADKAVVGQFQTVTSKEAAMNLIEIVQAKQKGKLTDPAYKDISCQNMKFFLPKGVLSEISKNPEDEKFKNKKIVLEDMKISGVDFSGASFGNGVVFKNVEFENCRFDNGCKFQKSVSLENLTFTNCEMGDVVLPSNLKGIQIRQNQGDKSIFRDATVEVPHTPVIPDGNTQLDKVLADMLGFVNSAVQMQTYCEKLGIKPLTTDANAYLDAMNVLAEEMKRKAIIGKEGQAEILDYVDIDNKDLDEKMKITESELTKHEALDKGDVKVADITPDGKEQDITEQEKEYTKIQAQIVAEDARQSFKEATKTLKQDLKLVLAQGIGSIKNIVKSHLESHIKTQESKLTKIAKEMSEVLTELKDCTKKYAIDMAEKDHIQGKNAINQDGIVTMENSKFFAQLHIGRLQNKVESLIMKEAEIQMKEIHHQITGFERSELADVASTMLTNTLVQALQSHPEVFKDGNFVIDNNVSLKISQDAGGNHHVSLDNYGNKAQLSNKMYKDRPIIDFSEYFSVKEQENIIKAIIEDCRVQDPVIKELLDHSHSIHMKDVTINNRTMSDTYDRVYKEMSKAYETLEATRESLLHEPEDININANIKDVSENIDDVSENIDEGPSLDDEY